MRSILFAAGLLLAAAAAAGCGAINRPAIDPAAGSAAPSRSAGRGAGDATGPAEYLVTGGAHFVNVTGLFRRVTFEMRQHADGTFDGEWNLVAGAAIIHGEPRCFRIVDGHTVRIGGVVENSHFVPNVAPGSGFVMMVTDDGEGANGTPDLTSRIYFNVPLADVDAFCETGTAPGPLPFDALTAGNVQILSPAQP